MTKKIDCRKPLKLLFAVALFCLQISAQTNKFVVTGTVVDDNGKPLEGAYVTLDGRLSCEEWKGWEDIRNSHFTDAGGKFRIETFDKRSSFLQFLYVTSPPVGVDTFFPPFLNSCPTDKAKPPVPILLEAGDETESENLQVQLWYSPVTIYLLGKDNQPFLKGKEWEKIWLTYRDEKKRFIQSGGIRDAELDTAIDRSVGSITVSLPEGEWYVEIQPDGEKGKWIAKTEKIIVRKQTPLRIILKPIVNRLQSRKR